jgi:hypothetical protein
VPPSPSEASSSRPSDAAATEVRRVVAISATMQRAVYQPDLRESFKRLDGVAVREVLNGSIYLYDWPLRRMSSDAD